MIESSLSVTRIYTPGEVLEGWRAYCLRSCKAPKLSLDRPSVSDRRVLDVQMIMYLRVEQFLVANRVFCRERIMCYRESKRFQTEWPEWYTRHTLAKVMAVELQTTTHPEHEPRALKSLVEEYNERNSRRVDYSDAVKAARDGRMCAWKPRGELWTSTMANLETWAKSLVVGRPRRVA